MGSIVSYWSTPAAKAQEATKKSVGGSLASGSDHKKPGDDRGGSGGRRWVGGVGGASLIGDGGHAGGGRGGGSFGGRITTGGGRGSSGGGGGGARSTPVESAAKAPGLIMDIPVTGGDDGIYRAARNELAAHEPAPHDPSVDVGAPVPIKVGTASTTTSQAMMNCMGFAHGIDDFSQVVEQCQLLGGATAVFSSKDDAELFMQRNFDTVLNARGRRLEYMEVVFWPKYSTSRDFHWATQVYMEGDNGKLKKVWAEKPGEDPIRVWDTFESMQAGVEHSLAGRLAGYKDPITGYCRTFT